MTKGDPLGREGQTLVIAILMLMVALIMIPYLVIKTQNEGKWTVKEARTTTAYHLAEAGQDRAVWYLAASTANWSNALNGVAITGYQGDVQYSDVSGGLYDINFSSGPAAYEITVVTKGRDSSTKEVRSIKAVYAGAAMSSGLITEGSFGLNPSFYVWWGQITAYGPITQQTGSSYGWGSVKTTAYTGCKNGSALNGVDEIPYYPYKDSASEVSPWDTSPTPPNSSTTENYTAYDTTLPSLPTINFDYYRSLAQNTVIPTPYDQDGKISTGARNSQWAGTGYFDGAGQGGANAATGGDNCTGTSGNELNWYNYSFNCSTCVIFFENDNLMLCAGSKASPLILDALILYQGNLHLHSTGEVYNLTPPSNAWEQYTAGTYGNPEGPGDSASSDEYPGDCGLHTTCSTYTVPNGSHTATTFTAPPFDNCGNTGLAFRGFLYVDEFNCAEGLNVISGQVYVGPDGTSIGTGDDVAHIIYYDPTIASAVQFVRPPLTRESWTEQVTTWP